MAVYTKINKKDISIINNKFDIEKIVSFQGIKKGIENTNYLLKSKNKKFILTIFEKRVSNKEIPFFMKLMDKLNINLRRENRMEMANACFDFLPMRAELDLAGWSEHDIFSHT